MQLQDEFILLDDRNSPFTTIMKIACQKGGTVLGGSMTNG